MKTAISVPDALMKRVNAFARRRKMARSRVFAMAVEQMFRRYDDEEIIRRYNEVYKDGPTPEERAWLEASTANMARLLKDEPW